MNRESQKRKILRFLKGTGKKDLDAFCIYQWIDRCHYEGWWDLARELAPNIPPNSLNHDYHKRLEYLLSECGKNLKSLKKEFIKIRNTGAETEFMLPRSFWLSCEEFGLSIRGKSKSGLRFELAGEQILFIQNIDLKSCVMRFYRMDSEKLSSWLNSHGFEHLIQGIIGRKDGGNEGNAKLKISWQEAENLMPSYIFEIGNTDLIFLKMFLEAFSEVENGTWGNYLNYIKEKYLILFSDEFIVRKRKDLIELFSKSNVKGVDQFIKAVEID